jgi:hypothetical protein
MSFETTNERDRFRFLNRLFEEFLRTDPSRWDEVTEARAVDPRLVVEARRLLALEQSGATDRHLKALIRAAQAVVRADAARSQEAGPGTPS